MPPVASSLGFHATPAPPTRVLVVGGPFPLEIGGDPGLGPGVSVAGAPTPATAVPLSDAHARLFVGLSVALAAAICAYDVVYLLTLV